MRILTRAQLTTAVFLAFGLVPLANAASAASNVSYWPGGGAGTSASSPGCALTSSDALKGCQAGASSDFWVATGKCDNISNSAARNACKQQASSDKAAALTLCSDQFTARKDVCEDLGPGTYEPEVDPEDFVAVIDNPYFPLTPGTTFVSEGQTADGSEHVEFVVTHNTREILGVTCIEVHDSVTIDGELREDTLDWFAQDEDGNVWYFGENTFELVGGLIVSLEGSWEAGVDGAKPGLIMEAHPHVDDFYRQEFALANAEDVAEVTSLNKSVTVPYGTFAHCLETEETTPLKPEANEHKFYAPGVGFVLQVDVNTGDRLELIQVTTD